MGERALAIVVSKGVSYLYRSQWGGSDDVLTSVFESARPLDRLCELEWQEISTCPPGKLVEAIDFLTTEILYLITEREVAVLLPLWVGLPGDVSEHCSNIGVLVPVISLGALRACREAHRSFKGRIHDLVREQRLSPGEGKQLLRQAQQLISVTSGFQLHSLTNIYNR